LKVTFLGTGTSQGVPVVACSCKVCQSKDPKDTRLRTSVLVEEKGVNIVIDTGPDFRQQMLKASVKHLDAVVFTHSHKDHTAGMDDVRGFNYVQGKPIDVYATEEVQRALRREFSYIFSGDSYPGIPKINLHTINEDPFKVGELNIIPVNVLHHRLPVLGFRIGDFTYITDANHINEKEKGKIKGTKVLVLNALRRKRHVSHFTLDEAVALFTEISPEQGFITHISHQMGLHDDIVSETPAFINPAFDGLVINI